MSVDFGDIRVASLVPKHLARSAGRQRGRAFSTCVAVGVVALGALFADAAPGRKDAEDVGGMSGCVVCHDGIEWIRDQGSEMMQ
jgi:hypothetical protein